MPVKHRNYVLGFAFSEKGKEVLVIKKAKPEWQAGKLNGIGGKVEPFEAFSQAMVREFREETNLRTTVDDWAFIGKLSGTDFTGDSTFTVYVYSLFNDVIRYFSSPTEEPVSLIPVVELDRYPHISNLDWLIPMALNHHSEKAQIVRLKEFEANYA